MNKATITFITDLLSSFRYVQEITAIEEANRNSSALKCYLGVYKEAWERALDTTSADPVTRSNGVGYIKEYLTTLPALYKRQFPDNRHARANSFSSDMPRTLAELRTVIMEANDQGLDEAGCSTCGVVHSFNPDLIKNESD